MDISHDSVNRFLNRESYDGEDLFNEGRWCINNKNVRVSEFKKQHLKQ
jgi:hypothetical protein